MATVFETDVEDYEVGDETKLEDQGWTVNDEGGLQSVVSSPAHSGARAIFLEDAGGIRRAITVTTTGIDLTYWVRRADTRPPDLFIRSTTSPFWAFTVNFGFSAGTTIAVASGTVNPSDVLQEVAYVPAVDTWVKIRVRAQKSSTDGDDDGVVLVSVDDVLLIEVLAAELPADFDQLEFGGNDAYLDDILMTDEFTTDPDPIVGSVALGHKATVNATRAVMISASNTPQVNDEVGTVRIAGDRIRLSGETFIPDLVVALPRIMYPLGGSRNQALQHNAVIDAYDYLDIEIDSDDVDGKTVQARVEVRVGNSGISVTPQIYNVTDASVEVTGSACSATNADYSGTDQKQTLTITPASGVKKYRLRLTPSANTHPVWGIGLIEVLP
jgi:hypothetical protein